MGSWTGGGTEARTPSRLNRRDGRCSAERTARCTKGRRITREARMIIGSGKRPELGDVRLDSTAHPRPVAVGQLPAGIVIGRGRDAAKPAVDGTGIGARDRAIGLRTRGDGPDLPRSPSDGRRRGRTSQPEWSWKESRLSSSRCLLLFAIGGDPRRPSVAGKRRRKMHSVRSPLCIFDL